MRIPTIHLNGTSKERLVSGYEKAHRALRVAGEALSEIEFNPRDYYVQGPQAWPEAVREMDERLKALAKIQNEIETILEEIL